MPHDSPSSARSAGTNKTNTMNTAKNIFDEATIRFLRIPESACEPLQEDDDQDQEGEKQDEKSPQSTSSPRLKVTGIKKSIDALSLVACRRQGVVPSSDLTATKKDSAMSWAEKQNRIGLLRVLALERARVASELHDVLDKECDPNARLKMEHELKLVQRETGASELVVADPEEDEMIKKLLSPHTSGATTAAIQERMIDAVHRRSERAVARMYRSHDRIMHNEMENHEKRVGLVHHLQEREEAREKIQQQRKHELHQKVVEQQELRDKKMSALRIRFAVINDAKKQELEDKIKYSDEIYEDAQRRQVGQLIERSDKQHEKILSVQEQVAKARREEWQRRTQLDDERRQKDNLHRERREEIKMKKDLRLEQRRQRCELLQVRAKELRDTKDEEMRKEFNAAHAEQLKAGKNNNMNSMKSSSKTASGGNSPSRPTTAASGVDSNSNNNARARALAYSRPSSKQQGGGGGGSDHNINNNQDDQNETNGKGLDNRRKVHTEEILRRQLLIQIQEQHNAKVLEERRIEVEAQRRVRQREDDEKKQHNRENLRRKERADQHRHQLQQALVEEAAAAAHKREEERLKAERKLQILKLDLAKQREQAQEKIREQEKKVHLLSDSTSNARSKRGKSSDGEGDGNNSPTPNKSGRASMPPSSDSKTQSENGGKSTKPTPQNSAIMAVIAGGKKK